MNGRVTDIQRFSLSDGDGIRTTVFLKGCNMHCAWCHNPETIDAADNLLFYENNCIGCGKCFAVCPQNAHRMEDGHHLIDQAACIGCGKCAEGCFAQALRFSSRMMTTEEVMAEILQDRTYYDLSGGGVTLSGGEVFCQREFAESIIDACRENGIRTAVETNLLHSFEKIEPILKKLDLVMFDIKLMDSTQHREATGTDNILVLENAEKLDALGIPLIVRTPLIPGITDTDENLLATAEFASQLRNLRRYELLNFNPLGESKYRALRKDNSFEAARPLSRQRLDQIRTLLASYPVKIS